MASIGSTILMAIVVILNMVAAGAGLALMALAIWVVVDSYGLYPLAKWTGKDDIFAAAWIAIFTGFLFFCTCVFGIYAALKRSRALMMTYLVVMLIIYIFECASCITSAVHRDYLVDSRLMKKEMLTLYTADGVSGNQVTIAWNRIMTEGQCCGTDGPLDWVQYNSTFQQKFGSSLLWPRDCCTKVNNYQPSNMLACQLGIPDSTYTQGCFTYIKWVFNTYSYSISWYGFAVLMFVFLVLLVSIVYYMIL